MNENATPDPKGAGVDKASTDIGLVAALPLELAPFLKYCIPAKKYSTPKFTFRGAWLDGIRIIAAESGVGFARARDATLALIDGHSPTWIISIGLAGGLRPGLKVGDIVVGTSIVDEHGQQVVIEMKMPEDPAKGIYVGRILTVDHVIRSAEEKKRLGEQYSALSVDLESLAVAQVCRERKVKFLAIRVISDDVDTTLPKEISTLFGATGKVRTGAIVGTLFRRPSSLKDLWNLRATAQKASNRLGEFLLSIVEKMGLSLPRRDF